MRVLLKAPPPEPQTPSNPPVKEELQTIAESPKASELSAKTPPSQNFQPEFTKPSVGNNSTHSGSNKYSEDLTQSKSNSPVSDRISSGTQESANSSTQKQYDNHANSNQTDNTLSNKDPNGQEKTTSASEKSFDSPLKSRDDKPSTLSNGSNDSTQFSPNQSQLSTQSPQDFKSGLMTGLLNQNSLNNLNRSLSSASSSETRKLDSLNDAAFLKESTVQSNSKAIEDSDESNVQESTFQSNEGYSVRGKSKTKTTTKSQGRKKNAPNDEATITPSNPTTFITNNSYYSNSYDEKSSGNIISGRKSSPEDSSYTLNMDGTFSRVSDNRSKNQITDSTDSKFISSSVQEDLDKVSTEIKNLESEVKFDKKEDESLWSKLSLIPEWDSLTKLLQDLKLTEDESKSTEITQLLDSTDSKKPQRKINLDQLEKVIKSQKPIKTALASNRFSQTADSGNVISRILSWFGF
jgi:hypothetical protein